LKVFNCGSFFGTTVATVVQSLLQRSVLLKRRTDCAPNCCTCGVGEGPDLKAIVGNDGDGDDHDGDEAIKEDCRLTAPDL
jgi:hypothetical protein